MTRHGQLPDGTEWRIIYLYSCGYPCGGGCGRIHVGTSKPAVLMKGVLFVPGNTLSSMKLEKQLLTCEHWSEVPIAIEAQDMRPAKT